VTYSKKGNVRLYFEMHFLFPSHKNLFIHSIPDSPKFAAETGPYKLVNKFSKLQRRLVTKSTSPVLIQETGRKNRQKINQIPNALMHDVFVATQFSIYYSVCICSGQSQLSKES